LPSLDNITNADLQGVASAVAEFVKSAIVDPEVMSDLVYDGDPDLLDHLLAGPTDRQDRVAEDLDAIR
jgi:hypothetical protein